VTDETSEEYQAAKRMVEAKLGFKIHAIVYVCVNVLLIIINVAIPVPEGGKFFPWFLFPLLGWGLGLLLHYFLVIKTKGKSLETWKEEKIQEEMEKAKKDEA